jgi:hypothetical protein
MTAKYYFATFGKTSVSEEQKKLLLADRSDETFENEREYRSKVLFVEDFEVPEKGKENRYNSLVKRSGEFSFQLDSAQAYSPARRVPYREITRGEYAWLRVTAWVFPVLETKGDEIMLVATFNHGKGLYKYRTVSLADSAAHAIPGQWNCISMDYMTPEVRSKSDKFSAYIWYRGESQIFVDDLQVEVFEK